MAAKIFMSFIAFGLIFIVILSLISGYSPTQLVGVLEKGSCYGEEKGATSAKVDFVGQMITVPSQHVSSCVLLDTSSKRDGSPARITLDYLLPGFAPLNGEEDQGKDGFLRVSLHGQETGGSRVNDARGRRGSQDLNKELAEILSEAITEDNEEVPLYDDPIEIGSGVLEYRKKIDRRRTEEKTGKSLFVFKNATGTVTTLLYCDRPRQVYFAICSSGERKFSDNVTYRYAFSTRYPPDIDIIDRKVESVISSLRK